MPDANRMPLTPEEQARLLTSRALIVGCGGLGGYLVELLARAGVGALRVADGDVFEPGNGNRQLLCEPRQIGRGKVEAARARVEAIGAATTVEAIGAYLTEANAQALLSGCDVALDALDSVSARRLLASACARANVPLVHAAIDGWRAQVAVVPPGSGLLDRVYPPDAPSQSEGTLSFVPAFAAAVQTAEAIQLLTGRRAGLSGRLLVADLLTQDWRIIEL